ACPFVQRARMLLNARRVPYGIEYIDLAGKPAWFLTGNYRVILEYNCSNYYAMSVGLLADEIVN
ncbi:MAG: lytic murein transglycosylase, partial [Pseudomonadota bacterium]